jgi:hypothetical protein
MDAHRFGRAFGAQFPAAILQIADQFLLLRVDRDSRLAGRLEADHLRVDVLELGIAIRLAAISRRPRSSRNGATASKRDLMPATSITPPKYRHHSRKPSTC